MLYFKVSELRKIQKDILFEAIPNLKNSFYHTLLKKGIEPDLEFFFYAPWVVKEQSEPFVFTSLDNTIDENINVSMLMSHNIKWLDTVVLGASFDNELIIGTQDKEVNDKKKRTSEPEFGKVKTYLGMVDDPSTSGIVILTVFNNETEEMKFILFECGNLNTFRIKGLTTDVIASEKIKKLQKEQKYEIIWNEM